MSGQLRKAVDEVGGEPLAGSGFEDESPEPEFSDSEPAASVLGALRHPGRRVSLTTYLLVVGRLSSVRRQSVGQHQL